MPRPKKAPQDKRCRAITMWVNETEEVEIKRRAATAGMSIADYLRSLAFPDPIEPLGPVPTMDGYVIG